MEVDVDRGCELGPGEEGGSQHTPTSGVDGDVNFFYVLLGGHNHCWGEQLLTGWLIVVAQPTSAKLFLSRSGRFHLHLVSSRVWCFLEEQRCLLMSEDESGGHGSSHAGAILAHSFVMKMFSSKGVVSPFQNECLISVREIDSNLGTMPIGAQRGVFLGELI